MLWLTSEAEARSPVIARTRLWERSQWRTLGTCPLCIAVRGGPMQPMLFSSPGSTTPSEWPAERRGRLQRDAGWGETHGLVLRLAAGVAPCVALMSLADAEVLELQQVEGSAHGMTLKLTGADGSGMGILSIPDGLR